jgi:ATP phosphoribosyltransferase regulatory subunit
MTGANNLRARNGRANGLVDLYERAGYVRVEPAVLQPADVFFELSGEELRRRLFLTENAAGEELCLRPDLTIPTCLAHLANGAELPASYCYLGPVFRDQGGGSGEYLQAGIESLGREDREAADAECIALALDSAKHFGCEAPAIRMGDVSLFQSLIAALDLPSAWQRRLLKDFNRTGTLEADLSTLKRGPGPAKDQAGVLAALQGSDPAAARALVTDLLSIAGISTVGGRTVAEIAERFLEQAALGVTSGLEAEKSRCSNAISRSRAIPTRRSPHCARLRPTRRSILTPRSTPSTGARDSSRRAASMSARSALQPPSDARSTITPAWCSSCTMQAAA